LLSCVWIYACGHSSWRVTTKLHSVLQTAVGALLGTLVGLYAFANEFRVLGAAVPVTGRAAALLPIALPESAQLPSLVSILPSKVPIAVRAGILIVGGYVLYSREIKKKIRNS
jgi:hypothetical protein